MLNSGNKINILTLVLFENKFLNETKTITPSPSCKINGRSLSNAKIELVNRGTEAMYEILKRGRLHNLSITCQLELFDSNTLWV